MTRPRRVLAAPLVAAACLVGITVAQAEHLAVAPAQLAAVQAGHPCPGTAVVGPADAATYPNYQGVVVSMPTGCAGLAVQVHVDRPATTTDRDGAGTAGADGVAALQLGGTYATNVTNTFTATVDGWNLPVTWNPSALPHIWCTVVDGTANTCRASVTIRTTSIDTYWDVVVTTTATTAVRWEVGFNLAHPFYGTQPTRLGNSDLDGYNDGQTQWAVPSANYTPYNDVTRVSSCSARPVLLVEGTNTGPNGNRFRDLRADRTRQFSLVRDVTDAGYFDVLAPGC